VLSDPFLLFSRAPDHRPETGLVGPAAKPLIDALNKKAKVRPTELWAFPGGQLAKDRVCNGLRGADCAYNPLRNAPRP
jgi:hypothetical protein